jgi:hypothetical protein
VNVVDTLWADPRPYSPYAPIKQARRSAPKPSPRDEVPRIAAQLDRVAETVPWGRIQDDAWDGLSRFIYGLRTAQSVRDQAERVAAEHALERTPFVHYALRRWYCFWGARLAELLFQEHLGVLPGPPRHHEIDFTIDGVPYDLKTTEVPRTFLGSIDQVAANPGLLASWLYDNQSREGRYHTANRLFLVLCDPQQPDEAWRLRGDVTALRRAIGRFMARRNFVELVLPDRYGIERDVLTAVIPVLPVRPGRQLSLF